MNEIDLGVILGRNSRITMEDTTFSAEWKDMNILNDVSNAPTQSELYSF